MGLALAPGCSATDELSERLTKAQYLVQLREAVRQVKANSDLPGKLIDVRSPQALAEVVAEAADELAELTSRLEDMRPPEEVQDLHNRLTGVVGGFSGLFSRSATALERRDYGTLVDVPSEARGLTSDLSDVTRAFAARGYDATPGNRAEPGPSGGSSNPGIGRPEGE